jgi:hypothetical protein
VKHNVSVGVADESAFVWNANTAQNQGIPCFEAVRIVA